MGSDDNWLAVHKFLFEHFDSQEPFTSKDLESKTTWSGQTLRTYFSKQLRQLLVPLGEDKYRVSEAFRRFSAWDRFHALVSQMRPVSSEYTSLTYDNVLIYEFFMPLTNEEHLRASLDALFYKDTILRRLRTVDPASLKKHYAEHLGESFNDYLERTATWVSSKFGGYSISHVSGRFKAAPLATFAAVAEMQAKGGRYLIDETTAVVRFIFPCGKAFRHEPPLTHAHFEEVGNEGEGLVDKGAAQEASHIRWFFGVLFVHSIVEVVAGEAEIWMVESGMRHRLHIWRVEPETKPTSSPPVRGKPGDGRKRSQRSKDYSGKPKTNCKYAFKSSRWTAFPEATRNARMFALSPSPANTTMPLIGHASISWIVDGIFSSADP